MAACISWYYVFGEAVINPAFAQRFVADPAGVYRQYGGSRLVPALGALTAEDRQLLGKQFASLNQALGKNAAMVGDHTALAIELGRALMEPHLRAELQRAPAEAMTKHFLMTDQKGEIATFFQQGGLKALAQFDKEREALRGAGERFSKAAAKSSARSKVLRDVLEDIQKGIEAGAFEK